MDYRYRRTVNAVPRGGWWARLLTTIVRTDNTEAHEARRGMRAVEGDYDFSGAGIIALLHFHAGRINCPCLPRLGRAGCARRRFGNILIIL